jgi:hypothetical protein
MSASGNYSTSSTTVLRRNRRRSFHQSMRITPAVRSTRNCSARTAPPHRAPPDRWSHVGRQVQVVHEPLSEFVPPYRRKRAMKAAEPGGHHRNNRGPPIAARPAPHPCEPQARPDRRRNQVQRLLRRQASTGHQVPSPTNACAELQARRRCARRARRRLRERRFAGMQTHRNEAPRSSRTPWPATPQLVSGHKAQDTTLALLGLDTRADLSKRSAPPPRPAPGDRLRDRAWRTREPPALKKLS